MKEDAMGRASKAERELDQARARAAVLENRLAVSGLKSMAEGVNESDPGAFPLPSKSAEINF